jgi:hypothetical protein
MHACALASAAVHERLQYSSMHPIDLQRPHRSRRMDTSWSKARTQPRPMGCMYGRTNAHGYHAVRQQGMVMEAGIQVHAERPIDRSRAGAGRAPNPTSCQSTTTTCRWRLDGHGRMDPGPPAACVRYLPSAPSHTHGDAQAQMWQVATAVCRGVAGAGAACLRRSVWDRAPARFGRACMHARA